MSRLTQTLSSASLRAGPCNRISTDRSKASLSPNLWWACVNRLYWTPRTDTLAARTHNQ